MADVIQGLNYRLAVDNTQFTTGIADSTKRLEQFATDTNRQAQQVQNSLGGVSQRAQNLFARLQSEGAEQGLAAVQGHLGGMLSTLTASVGPVTLFASGFVAAFGAIVTAADKAAASVRNINSVARTLSTNTGDAQTLLKVFERGGIDQGGAQASLFRFQSHIGQLAEDPNAQIGKAFGRLGIDKDLIQQVSLRDALATTFEALKKHENAFERSRLAQEIFGRSAVDLAPLIARGGRAINEASREVERYGITAAAAAEAKHTDAFFRQFEQQNGRVTQRVAAAWRDWTLQASHFVDNLDYAFSVFTGRVNNQAILAPGLPNLSPDPFKDLSGQSEATVDAEKLLHSWRDLAATIGLTAREVAIFKAQQSQAAEQTVLELQHENAILTELEHANQAKKLIEQWELLGKSIGLTARQAQIFKLATDGLDLAAVRQLQRQDSLLAKLEEENKLRQQIQASFSFVGIEAGSIEGAKLVADLQIRRNNGVENQRDQQEAQGREILETLLRDLLTEQRTTNDYLRNAPIVTSADY